MTFVRRLRQHDVTGAEPWSRLSLLAAIDRLGEKASPSGVGQILGLRSSNVAAALREAEQRDYVSKEATDDDRRKARLLLTPKGARVLSEARLQRSQWLEQAIQDHLSEKERELLFAAGDLLEKLANVSSSSEGAT